MKSELKMAKLENKRDMSKAKEVYENLKNDFDLDSNRVAGITSKIEVLDSGFKES